MKRRALRERLSASPRAKLADLAEGTTARVIGRTRRLDLDPASLLEAPFSGRPCVFYQAIAEARTAWFSGWSPVTMVRYGVPFLIQDGSARAVIEPVDAEIDFSGHMLFRAHRGTTPRELAFLTHQKALFAADRRLRYREWIIGVDELVAVLGAGIREGDPLAPPPPDYRSEPPTRLRFASGRNDPLLISVAEDVVLAP